jgi:dTDP-4-amino-4,6-dideoxygalactose transaminase
MAVEELQEYMERRCTRDHRGRLISRRYGKIVSAVVPVHLYGQMADMDGIAQIAEEHNLMIIEDACQAHGAEWFSKRSNRWIRSGSIGRAAAFSFYPGKNLGACGEGGAVTTNDASLAEKIRMLRDHGQSHKYYHNVEGFNGRLDAIQAGLLNVKLRYLPGWNALRRELAATYNRLLADADGVSCPYEPTWSRAVYHLYVVRTRDRDAMISHLKEAGIGTGIHYPLPLHLQQAYLSLGYKRGDFPVTERAAAEIISLPMFPQLTAAQQARVTEEVCAFTARMYSAPPESDQEAVESVAQVA